MITYLELGRMGRMGNALFEIAGTIGIAIKSNQDYAFPKLVIHDMKERFNSTEDIEVWKHLINPLPELQDAGRYNFLTHHYFWDYRETVLPVGNWNLTAHFQSVKYFNHCIDLIRDYFTFKDEYEKNDYTCLHWRAGDYIDNQDAYHPRCNTEYYAKALMGYIPEGSTILVFSDDVDEAYKMFKHLIPNAGMKAQFWDRNNYIETFKMMKACKNFICANSSFSHMAALLSNHPEKKIIMPKKWFGAQANGLSFDSLYPNEAIVL